MEEATRRPVMARTAGRVAEYVADVRAEVRKVTWPGLDELKKSTGVIIIFLILMGLLIGLMDALFSLVLVRWLGRLLG
ncbi:MAG TPA: preprotein translocase subunit SecE [Gemmatimonadales bacterium]|nr:preprotein translocase subunit SecE [Gemmatimonadales bacterium]